MPKELVRLALRLGWQPRFCLQLRGLGWPSQLKPSWLRQKLRLHLPKPRVRGQG
jgi:hypothetical protein